jgi:hypothetical protein
VDDRARRGAEALGLPTTPEKLHGLVSDGDFANFVAGLVRISLNTKAVPTIKSGN